MTTADTPAREIEHPLDLDNDTAIALLRWCGQQIRDDLALPPAESVFCDGEQLPDDERAYLERGAAGFDEAADLLAADPLSPVATLVLWYVFDESWNAYAEHVAGIVEAEIVDEGEAGRGN